MDEEKRIEEKGKDKTMADKQIDHTERQIHRSWTGTFHRWIHSKRWRWGSIRRHSQCHWTAGGSSSLRFQRHSTLKKKTPQLCKSQKIVVEWAIVNYNAMQRVKVLAHVCTVVCLSVCFPCRRRENRQPRQVHPRPKGSKGTGRVHLSQTQTDIEYHIMWYHAAAEQSQSLGQGYPGMAAFACVCLLWKASTEPRHRKFCTTALYWILALWFH